MHRSIPIGKQLFLMKLGPSQYQVLLASWHCTSQQGWRVNGETGLIFTKARVKVWALMRAGLVIGQRYTHFDAQCASSD